MIFERIWGWLPVYKKVAAARSLLPFAGRSFGLWIAIDVRYIDDKGLLIHELTHAKQFYRTVGLHLLLYRFSARYRYRSEIECYRAQLAVGHNNGYSKQARRFARFIATRYRLDVTIEEAVFDLTET